MTEPSKEALELAADLAWSADGSLNFIRDRIAPALDAFAAAVMERARAAAIEECAQIVRLRACGYMALPQNAIFNAGLIMEDLSRLEQKIRALAASPPPSDDGWQPIETAPREEGVWIFAAAAGSKIPMVAGWDEDDGRWFAFNRVFSDDWIPTHWRPLPAPPRQEGQ